MMNFLDVWDRIKKETPLKSLNDLAALVETSQPNVSRQKKEGVFPPGWAYLVGKKYGLLTEWIMTGEGPKRLGEGGQPQQRIIRGYLAEWIEEQEEKDPNFFMNFTSECLISFPEFAEWLKKRKATTVAESGHSRQNVA